MKQWSVIAKQDYLEIFHALVEHIQKANGRQSCFICADGYFKMHMPVDLTDKRTTYAVAIKLDPAKRNEIRDVVKILDITTNADGSKTTKVIHQPV